MNIEERNADITNAINSLHFKHNLELLPFLICKELLKNKSPQTIHIKKLFDDRKYAINYSLDHVKQSVTDALKSMANDIYYSDLATDPVAVAVIESLRSSTDYKIEFAAIDDNVLSKIVHLII